MANTQVYMISEIRHVLWKRQNYRDRNRLVVIRTEVGIRDWQQREIHGVMETLYILTAVVVKWLYAPKFIELNTKQERTSLYVNYTLIKMTFNNYIYSSTFVLHFIYFLNKFWTALAHPLNPSLKYQLFSKSYPSTPIRLWAPPLGFSVPCACTVSFDA